VDEGKFRADLLDRLSFEVITLPPLRVRQGDIPLLAEHFGRRMAVELDWPNWPGFSDSAMRDMERYRWPGNVRELRNVVERAVYRWEDAERAVEAIQFDPFHSPWAPSATTHSATEAEPFETKNDQPADQPAEVPLETQDFRGSVDSYERALLEQALNANRFNQRATAAAIGLSYDQLRHALKRHKLLDAGSR